MDVQGFSIEAVAPATGSSFPDTGPSLLGMPYLAVHSAGSAVAGSTKREGLTPADAVAELSRTPTLEETQQAVQDVLCPVTDTWHPLEGWQVDKVGNEAVVKLENVMHCNLVAISSFVLAVTSHRSP